MHELVGFQTMMILDPYGMTFDALGVFGLIFWLLFKSGSSYCGFDKILYQAMQFLQRSDKYMREKVLF